jgi:hypothetical protein
VKMVLLTLEVEEQVVMVLLELGHMVDQVL